MAAWAEGAWAPNVWAGTAWAVDAQPVVETPRTQGGGRIIGYYPSQPPKPKQKVILHTPTWTDDKEEELKRLVKIDHEKREKEYKQLVALTDKALDIANTVHITAELTDQQIKRFRKRLRDEDVLLLLDGDESLLH